MAVDEPSSPVAVPLSRLEAFSDGVFAIAIRLLVLELALSADAGDGLLHAILDEWPAYLAYLTSFLTIGIAWLLHSAITSLLRAANDTLARLNLLVLLFASFLPFPPKLLAEFVEQEEPERVAVVFYGLVLLALDLALTLVARYALGHRDLVREGVAEERRIDLRNRGPSLVYYAIAIGIGFLQPAVAIWLYLGIALALWMPGRIIRRVLRRP